MSRPPRIATGHRASRAHSSPCADANQIPDAIMGTAQISASSVTHAVMLLLTAMAITRAVVVAAGGEVAVLLCALRGWVVPWWLLLLLSMSSPEARMDGHKKGRAFGRFGERWRRVLREDDVWARARICSGGTPPTLRRVGRSVGLGRCIPWPRPTGTVAEAWSVCSYAPSAGHTNTRDGVSQPKESLLLPSCSFSLERRSGTWPLSSE